MSWDGVDEDQAHIEHLANNILRLEAQVATLTAERNRLADEREHYRESYHVVTAGNSKLRAEVDTLQRCGSDMAEGLGVLTRERDALRAEVETRTLHLSRSLHAAQDAAAEMAATVDALRAEAEQTKDERDAQTDHAMEMIDQLHEMMAERDALRLDLARVTEERELAKADALILAHAYKHDSNPPQIVVTRALAYRGSK